MVRLNAWIALWRSACWGRAGYRYPRWGSAGLGLSYHRSATLDRSEAIALIRQAVDLRVTFFDTAQVDGLFTNERLVGDALAPVRDQVVVATKFGEVDAGGQPADRPSRLELIRQTTDAPGRLGVETIDGRSTSTESIPTCR